MKRIKAVNGYTIYEATERDTKKYNVDEGYFYIYFSSDIRDFGIANSEWDFECGSVEEAMAWCEDSNYAIAKEIVEAQTTAASYEEIVEVEKKLDSGITLNDYVELTQCDYDTFDSVYDTCVTVCYIDTIEDDYDRFCTELIKKVKVLEVCNRDCLVCNWSQLIYDNLDSFKAFANKYWHNVFTDDENLVYAWINEIHMYLAGYVSEDFYTKLVEFVDTLKA